MNVAVSAITVCCHKNVITSGPDPLRMWLLGSNLNRFLVYLNRRLSLALTPDQLTRDA